MEERAKTATATGARPHRPSFLDRLIAAIERLPIPAWLFYLLFLLLMMLANNARQWLDGTAPPGSLDLARLSDAFYSIYFVAVTHHLNSVARRAFQVFRPLLDLSAEESLRVEFALTTLPARTGVLALILGAVLAALGIGLDPLAFGLAETTPIASWVYVTLVTAFNTATLVAAALHSLRQLQLVGRLHAQASSLDLLNPKPIYAFSALTVRAGLALIAFAWFMAFQDPTPGLNVVSVTGLVVLVGLGAASFVLPLVGLHQRLIDEKDRLISSVTSRLAAAFGLVHEQVDRRELGSAMEINQLLAALKLERDTLLALPTWPWRPGTLRGFASAVVLPVLIWLLTALLERVLSS
ncbi:MAG: hypothetical protein JXA74_17320 [Anaerolineae bacterium]|nr:hypothetical protein [Anaerolineae bacterium]